MKTAGDASVLLILRDLPASVLRVLLEIIVKSRFVRTCLVLLSFLGLVDSVRANDILLMRQCHNINVPTATCQMHKFFFFWGGGSG